ncbi:MAG TPA: hypothetical protein PLM07_13700 [Candidatus Rifleibacterium sp.]|nr:hypothetical protein [Candidatus Rifleibacterium sp.]HPT46940.1 hypothetical protein [Candidatus Rifleibacterium sp.]
MIDQASSLRRLKQMADISRAQSTPKDAEGFLAGVVRPSPFATVAIIIPEMPDVQYPPVLSWISGIMQFSPRACFWDQAGIIKKESIPQTQIRLRYPVPVRVNAGLTPLSILPQQLEFADLPHMPQEERISFLNHIIRSLKSSSEVWISIGAGELQSCSSLLHSTDAVCIMVPPHPDAILRCYETVKSVHLSGYFSPIGLLDFTGPKSAPQESSSNRIKTVAKQFLALDLVSAGMVLSNCTYLPPENEACLRDRIQALESASKDFLYCLSESLVYPLPGNF